MLYEISMVKIISILFETPPKNLFASLVIFVNLTLCYLILLEETFAVVNELKKLKINFIVFLNLLVI